MEVVRTSDRRFLWIAVANEPELSTFVSVPIEFKDLPEELEISSDVMEKVELEMSGPSGELRDFAGSRTAVVLDLSDAAPGERTYRIHEGTLHLPRGLRLIRSIPAQVRFQFEPRRQRTVPVVVRFTTTRRNSRSILPRLRSKVPKAG